jgi:hypothetical protein
MIDKRRKEIQASVFSFLYHIVVIFLVGGLQLRVFKAQLQIEEQGLNLSESQQQGHSNTYNTLF